MVKKAKQVLTKQEFIKEIKDWAYRNEFNQLMASSVLGISPSTLSELLNNKNKIPEKVLVFFGRTQRLEIKESYPQVSE